MYRFLISRKTILLLASIWIASGTLLFIGGWLLGRHQSSPTVDATRLAELLDSSSSTRLKPAAVEPSPPAKRRNPEPWKHLPSSKPATSAPSAAPSPTPSRSSETTPATDTESSGDAGSSSSKAPAKTSESPSPSGSTAASSPSSFSLQIGAFSSEQNARDQVDEISSQGLAPYIVPVIDGDRTLYTVRVGQYETRDDALQAADELRSSKDLSAVIRSLNTG